MELYNEPANLFVAGFIGSPAMNFMPARIEGDSVKLPVGTVTLPQHLRERVGRVESGKALIAGIRPESFDEAGSAGAHAGNGCTFTAKIEVLEAMGSEFYAHFTTATDQTIDSAELRELAEDSGAGDVPMSGEQGRIVARLDPGAHVRQGAEAELWLDASALHLFDPEDGRALTSSTQGPAATDGRQPGGRDPNEGSDAGA
jgi:multiple sugar transport system ATP-binding protein